MNPENYSYVMPKLFEEGALDVYYIQIMMKKNRQSIIISVLCREDKSTILENILFTETSTLGIRKLQVDREVLE